jgi:hypothetical protein
MRRFEGADKSHANDREVTSRYDVPTVHSLSFECSAHDLKVTLSDFTERLRQRGVDVDKHSAILRQAHSDIAVTDSNGEQAIESVLRTVRWKESTRARPRPSGRRATLSYERRANGYEDDDADESF